MDGQCRLPSVQDEERDAVGDGQQRQQHDGRRQLLVAPGEQPAHVDGQVGEEQQPEGRRQRHRRQVHRADICLPPQLGQRCRVTHRPSWGRVPGTIRSAPSTGVRHGTNQATLSLGEL